MVQIMSLLMAVILLASPVHAEGTASLSVSAYQGSEVILFFVAEETDEGYKPLSDAIEDISSTTAEWIISSGALSDFSYFTAAADEEGTALFENLEPGIYLAAQNGIAEDENGVEYEFEPFLVTVSEGEGETSANYKTVDEIYYEEIYGESSEITSEVETESEGLNLAAIILVVAAVAAAAAVIALVLLKRKKKSEKSVEYDDLDKFTEEFYDDSDDFYDEDA